MKPFSLLERVLHASKKIIPRRLFSALQPTYHYLLSFLGALIYRFPSRKLTLIAVTGTKGKTSVAEITNGIFEEAGYTTALSSTLRFKIGDHSENNMYKMTLPGRFFLQKFLRRAVSAGCTHAIIEITSEAAKQYRHKFLALDALMFTNISPEHIESHGSFEKYLAAKLAIAEALAHSSKKKTVIVVNKDDAEGEKFLAVAAKEKHTYSLTDARPYEITGGGITLTFRGKKISSPLRGEFNIANILAAATCAEAFGITSDTIARGIAKCAVIRGRMEEIREGQDFAVYVDYAHTPDSLQKAYTALSPAKLVCVLGGTGGGRDRGKRPLMGAIAEKYCSHIILTDEDPYDENPMQIITDIQDGIKNKNAEVVLDRREAIRRALSLAGKSDAVIITGKGTDPYIMGPNNTRTPWSDAEIAREEICALVASIKKEGQNSNT